MRARARRGGFRGRSRCEDARRDPTEGTLRASAAPPREAAAALWDAIQRASGEYVVVVDRTGIIRWCSRIDDGFEVDQVIGQNVTQFTLPESAAGLTEMLGQVLETSEVRRMETTVRRLDGGLNYFSLRLGPIRRAGRTVAGMVCCENIRPRKDSELALIRERSVLRQLLEIQERERQLASYDIHDGLAQYLAGAIMHVQACEAAVCDHAGSREPHEALRLLQAAVEESRRLIGGLRPPALDELGIVAAIDALVSDARTEVPEVRFGLAGIRQRSRLVGVEPRIESTPGGGTVVEVRVPLAAAG